MVNNVRSTAERRGPNICGGSNNGIEGRVATIIASRTSDPRDSFLGNDSKCLDFRAARHAGVGGRRLAGAGEDRMLEGRALKLVRHDGPLGEFLN